MNLSVGPHLLFGLDPIWVSLFVLAVAYALIIAAPFNHAISGIDWNISALGRHDESGLDPAPFRAVSIPRGRVGTQVRANPAGIPLMLQLATAVLSAVLNNVSTVLLMVPATLVIAEEPELPPFPFLFAEVFAADIGGAATLIGDPPNVLIGTQAGLESNAFLAHAAH